MIKTTMTALMITATLFFTLALRASDPAAEKTLQQAIDFLESKGDLARATPLFEQVTRSSDRELAARSLLYLGQIQERQGKERARATYQRIVKEFATQRDATAEAGRRLAGLGDVRSTSNAIVLSRIWASDNSPGADHTLLDISPDGRFLAQASKTGLLLHDLSSSEKDRSLRSAPSDSPIGLPITHPHFTPDGKRVVYSFAGKDGVREVRTINIDGTDEQTIIRSPGYDRFQVTAISPDGKLAAVSLRRDDSVRSASNQNLWQAGILSLQTGKLDILTDADAYVGNFSPDGRWLVYASEMSGKGAIYTIAVDGSGVTNELLAQPMLSIDTPYFSPDGSKVLQVFRPGGATSTNLYSIPVADGKKMGPPQIVREGVPAGSDTWGPDVMGFARDGAFYVSELRQKRVVVWKIQNLFPQVSTAK